jgi:hypothetical protein
VPADGAAADMVEMDDVATFRQSLTEVVAKAEAEGTVALVVAQQQVADAFAKHQREALHEYQAVVQRTSEHLVATMESKVCEVQCPPPLFIFRAPAVVVLVWVWVLGWYAEIHGFVHMLGCGS